MSNKKGLAFVLDRLTALHARITSTRAEHETPPTTIGDERLIDRLGHWEQLCVEAIIEAITELKQSAASQFNNAEAIGRMTARLALPSDASLLDIADAVTIAVRRLQELEQRVLDFQDAHTPPPRGTPILHSLFGVGPSIERAEKPRTERSNVERADVDDRVEGLVLGGWLRDAAEKLERVGDYLRSNESRMSEDLFDELGRISGKVANWGQAFLRGDFFPEVH